MSSNGASPKTEAAAGVLICDDNDAIRLLLGVVVGSHGGLRVLGEASNGDQAIAEATRLQPDVILLDLAMPKRSGLEAIPELREAVPTARIIVFSAFSGAAVAEQVLALGAASYLEKGVSPDTIVATIVGALANTDEVPLSLSTSA